MNNDLFKDENCDKNARIDVFYREKPPSLKTLRKIKEILNVNANPKVPKNAN